MKKTLLLASLFAGGLFTMNAQTTVWSDDFNDEDISDWTLVDADGDGFQWGDMFTVNNSGGNPVTPVSLISRSWQGAALNPDNWAISPAIDLTNASGTITLTWKVQAAAASWDLENYTVYAATENSTASLSASSVNFTEIYPGGGSGASLDKELDLSSFAGQTIYIAFRHHDCTDQDFLSIDDVTVTAESTASVDSPLATSFSVYPNPAKDVLNISNSIGAELLSVTVTDLNGRTVKQINSSVEQINISDLNAGVYFVNINSTEGSLTKKIVKK